MGFGTSDGQYFDDETSYLSSKADSISIRPVQTPSTMPLGAPTEPTGALKSSGSTETPGNSQKAEIPDFTNDRPHDIVEKLATGFGNAALSAFTLPGDVLSGKVQAGSVQEIERAADLAGFMVGGPAPVAAKMADGTLGSFAGVSSKTLNKTKLYEAQDMAMNAAHPDEIWQQTGFFKGADGRWRYEIPDQNATIKDSAFNKTILQSNPNAGGEADVLYSIKDSPRDFFGKVKEDKALRLPDVLDHPDLYAAYPSLMKTKVQPLPQHLAEKNVFGQFDPNINTLYLGKELHPEFLKSVLLHESQHHIQTVEKFARGGGDVEFLDPTLAKAQKMYEDDVARGQDPKILAKAKKILEDHKAEAFENYKRLMGEVEARNVQARMRFNNFTRQNNPPRTTEDRPRFIQIQK